MQAVFLPILILITALFVVAMPAVVIAVASERWTSDPDKFAFTVFLTRITFPYLIFISMVSLFSGILNSLSRFVAAAFAPALLNVALLAALLLVPEGGEQTAVGHGLGGPRRRRASARPVHRRDAPRRPRVCSCCRRG